MPADRFFIFEKRGQAFAFVDGVEWANESSIEFMEVCRLAKRCFVARFIDNDKPESESEPYPDTWSTGIPIGRDTVLRMRSLRNYDH